MNDMTAIKNTGGKVQPAYPLTAASIAQLGFHAPALAKLRAVIESHITEGRYPGAQIALARHGQLALFETFGQATVEGKKVANDETLWLLFSNTKVITAMGIWALVEDGLLTFNDRIAEHMPGFAQHGKGDITLAQVLSHRAGFPSQNVTPAVWTDHAEMRKQVCNFTLEWTPGSRLHYHPRAALWVAAALIETVSGMDYRDFLRQRIIEPLGLGRDIYVGMPDTEHARAASIYEPDAGGKQQALKDENTAPFRRAGVPSSGGYATARGMAALYQMLANFGKLNGTRIFSRRLVEFVTRNHTGDMHDGGMNMPMHRGLGVHVRGMSEKIRGLGAIASPRTFGHGGVGTSYCWADPDSGVSFAYITNSRQPDPWHSRRLDVVANLVHSAIE
ncbi:MAG TPA: serine hydrolase domain-containing protein [Burkholderiales bacterium]|nr:serine hydrolase domain-containing protein [Burkholderiales bacterium]